MNERIEELKRLATEVERGHGAFGEVERTYRLNVDKFAELIIRECISIVNTWSDDEPCSEGYDIFPVYEIKKRFGITE